MTDRDLPEVEWRRLYEQGWCGAKTERDGHFLPCSEVAGHDGDCIVSDGRLRDHKRAGRSKCVEHRCPSGSDDSGSDS